MDDWKITLPLIRKKYHKCIICPDKLNKNCWNVSIEDCVLSFHYYWEDDENEYLNSVTIDIDENMNINKIYPLEAERQSYCDIRRSDYSPCRATSLHYMQFDSILDTATISPSDWETLSSEDKAQVYSDALTYFSSWEKNNPPQNKEQSFIPTLEKKLSSATFI